MNLVSVEVAAELLNTTKSSLMSTACVYRKNHGKYPKFYISSGKRGASKSWVDMDVLDRNRQIVRSMWMYSTDSLYWVLSSDLGLSDTWIARRMSELSSSFKTMESWLTFLRGNLFGLPPENAYAITKDMRAEFFKLSIRLIAVAKKDGRLDEYLS